ncbi:hypothetical protein OKJ48_00435 [Streptomyces kunmingensis]|uniref:Uncharacterized protein n=1 Tax=Streptomyces kunmingensis TaxID=68225 RepID=A0ABU6C3E5_9ACTN|nr:hypothetical protein [Streptomyces kunmingensis]MEB3958731.1 hypothetical protein [Streptomyces kunmingensis]
MIRKAAASASVALALLVASPAAAWAAPSAPQKDPVEVCKKLVELVKILNPSAPAADLDKLCEPKSPSPATSPSPSPSTSPSA